MVERGGGVGERGDEVGDDSVEGPGGEASGEVGGVDERAGDEERGDEPGE